VHDFCDEAAPSRLMRCADASPVIAMKVFVELDVVAKMWIRLKDFLLSVDRPSTIYTSQEKPGQPATQFGCNLVDG